MRLKILAEGRTIYSMDVLSVLRVESLRGRPVLALPKSGTLEVVITIEYPEHTSSLGGSEIRVFGVRPVLATDELDD